MIESLRDIIAYNQLPHKWCPGCGHGIILSNLGRALTKLGLENDKVVIVSGIGCSGRASKFFNTFSVHTTHGRPIAFATGIALANPDLKVIVLTGDGDCAAIGGNHFIHACRRNIDLTVVVFNNGIYGMTGGQGSPLSAVDSFSSTMPFGNFDNPFDICSLAQAAGASYIARGLTAKAIQLPELFSKGIEHKGLSVIDVITQCTVHYGRKNNMRSAAQMLDYQKQHFIPKSQWEIADSARKEETLPTGVLYSSPAKDYFTKYHELCERVQKVED